MRNNHLVELFVLGALWGASFLFLRVAVPEIGPLTTIGLRLLLAALVLVVVLAFRHGLGSMRPHIGPLLVVGVFNSALPFCLLAFALMSVTTAMGAILNATTALFSALLAWLWLSERLSLLRVLGLGLGFFGVVLLVWGQLSFKDGGDGLAILAGLAAAMSYSLAAIYTRRKLHGVASLTVATGSQISGALIMVPLMLWAWPTQPPSPQAWGSVVLLAVACTAVAYILYFRLIARLGAQGAVTVTYLIPVFAVLWGDLFLGEYPTLQMLLGGATVLVGVGLATGWLGSPRAKASSNSALSDQTGP